MPHARPEDGAINSGLVVMTLKEPVYFGHEDHDPVSIVVGMSATDKDQHVKNIQNLALVLGDNEKLKAIQQAQNPIEITTIMNNEKWYNPMKILTVCGLGMGTSLILSMNVTDVLKAEFDMHDAKVEHMDVSAAKSSSADLIITNSELIGNLRDCDCPVVEVNDYVNKEEIKAALIGSQLFSA